MARKKYYSNERIEDSGMIREDRSAVANLPQNVMMKEWPKVDYTGFEGLDDTIRGVDQQMRDDARGGKKKRGRNPEKW